MVVYGYTGFMKVTIPAVKIAIDNLTLQRVLPKTEHK